MSLIKKCNIKKIWLILLMFCVSQYNQSQNKQLSVFLDATSQISGIGEGGLFFAGTSGVNYTYAQRISPHGDCVDVVNGYAFVTWYKGGMDSRNLMLSRKNLNVPNSNWVTIQFPHQHVGQSGEILKGTGIRGDSHNTAAIGISTIDNTIHIIYDMHAYTASSLPNHFFNYSVSLPNKAFVPDNEFTLDIFNPKRNYLKAGQNYERMSYPMIHRADDGSLVVRYRKGGSGNGDIFMAHYDGVSWSNDWLFQRGTLNLPDRNSLYGGERFLNGKFYSGFSIRYANNNSDTPTNGYSYNSGLYYAYTNGIPKNQSTQWYNVKNNPITLPIINNLDPNLDPVQIAQPGDDFGTTTNPRTTFDPSWTVTQSGAIHFITRVDNINVHYYKNASDINFSKNSGGLIPNPEVRGEIYSYKNHVFMVELIGGKVTIKTTLEGQNNWKIIYSGNEVLNYAHFDAFVTGNKLYVYLMQDIGNNTPGVGDKRPLFFQEFTLGEIDVPVIPVPNYTLEAEDYTTASPDIIVGSSISASGGEYIDSFAINQFLEYRFQVTQAGLYDLVLYVAVRNRDDSIMDVTVNGQLYNDVLMVKTGDWNVYGMNTIPNVLLVQGENVIRLKQERSLSSEPDKLELYLKSPLSLEKLNLKNLEIYPNPSNGLFNLKTDNQNLKYKLINIHGQVLENGKIFNNELDFSVYSKGVYFLKLAVETGWIIKKVIIN